MMEFMLTMTAITLVFVISTALVALVAGGLLRLKSGIFKARPKDPGPELPNRNIKVTFN